MPRHSLSNSHFEITLHGRRAKGYLLIPQADGAATMRITKREMDDRKHRVLLNLVNSHSSTLEQATQGLELNYLQKNNLLKDMEEDGTVVRIGKTGASILYRRAIPRSVTERTARHLGQSLTVVGAHMDGLDLIWELKAPNGSTLNAKLLEAV